MFNILIFLIFDFKIHHWISCFIMFYNLIVKDRFLSELFDCYIMLLNVLATTEEGLGWIKDLGIQL